MKPCPRRFGVLWRRHRWVWVPNCYFVWLPEIRVHGIKMRSRRKAFMVSRRMVRMVCVDCGADDGFIEMATDA